MPTVNYGMYFYLYIIVKIETAGGESRIRHVAKSIEMSDERTSFTCLRVFATQSSKVTGLNFI